MALPALLSLAVCIGSALAATRAEGIPLQQLGVYFDGRVYLEIARSFPLPFAPQALDYAGHAPGYPAGVWLLHGLSFASLWNWGGAMLLASWLPAAGSALLFYLVCRELELKPLLPSALFVLAFPRWVSVAATPHAEPAAMAFALGSLLAYLRGHAIVCALLLVPATLCRFPAAALAAPLALGFLLGKRPRRLRALGAFAAPLAALGLLHVYLALRIPDFTSIAASHRVFWHTQLTWPFAALLQGSPRALWPAAYPLGEITYLAVGLYLFAMATGFERGRRDLWVLPLWIAAVVLPHASLSGMEGAWDFTRLSILAWPAALLILWRQIAAGVPAWAGWAAALVLGAFSIGFGVREVSDVIRQQRASVAYLVPTLADDRPHWDSWKWSRQ